MTIRDRTCTLCNKIFSSKQMANLHKLKKVCEKRAKLFCPKCGKKFKNKRDLQRHAKNKKMCVVKSCKKVAHDTIEIFAKSSNSVNLNPNSDSSFCEELLPIGSKNNPKNDTFLLNSEKNDTFLLNDTNTPTNKVTSNDINVHTSHATSAISNNYVPNTLDSFCTSSTMTNIQNKIHTPAHESSISLQTKKTKKTKKTKQKHTITKIPILTHDTINVAEINNIITETPGDFLCNFCGKNFKKKYNRDRHEKKNCKFTVSKIQQLEDKIKNLELNLTNINNNNTTIINNTYNIQTTNKIENDNSVHNTININSFGQENTSGISRSDMINITNKCFGAVLDLFQKIHLDTPENRNLYLPEVKNKHLYMKEDDKWVCVLDYNPIFKQIQDNNIEIIEDFISNNKDIFSHSKKKNINRMIESYHNGQLTDGYNKQLKELLYNNRNLLRPLYISDKKITDKV